LKKGIIVSADLHPILCSEERFCVPLKQITLSRVEIRQFFTRC
jgi:hypothetical protein